MGSGIRAEVKVESPASCPIAQLSAATESSGSLLSKSVNPDVPERVTQEFVLHGVESIEHVDVVEVDVTDVFSYGSDTVYRFSRPSSRGCPCETVEQFDFPVIEVTTEDGALFLDFHVPNVEDLREVLGALREEYPDLDVRRLMQSSEDRSEQNLVHVDQNVLTDRQREVLETANRMGYFAHPKEANAGDVADELDISTSTFTQHLSAAQKKLLQFVLED